MDKKYIQENLLTKSGSLNSNKTKSLNYSNQKLYEIFHEIDTPKCICGEDRKFYNFVKGFSLTCGNRKCVDKHPERIKKIIDNTDQQMKGKKISKSLNKRSYNEVKEATRKSKKTRLELYGDENYVNKEKAIETCLERYGVEYSTQSNPMITKTRKIKLERYGNEFFCNQSKSAETKRERYESEGKMIPLSELSDFKYYARLVRNLTEKQPLHTLENYELRGRNSYHLDHKFSIFEGYKNSILPIHIADISNLEMLPEADNISKGSSCSIEI